MKTRNSKQMFVSTRRRLRPRNALHALLGGIRHMLLHTEPEKARRSVEPRFDPTPPHEAVRYRTRESRQPPYSHMKGMLFCYDKRMKGFAPIVILVILAGVLVAGAVFYYVANVVPRPHNDLTEIGYTQNSSTASIPPPTPPAVPVTMTLSSLDPPSGPVGTKVTIVGSGFSSEGNVIHFASGGNPSVSSIDGTHLTFQVPRTAGPCDFRGNFCMAPDQLIKPGSYSVYVSNANGRSNALVFKVTASLVSPR